MIKQYDHIYLSPHYDDAVLSCGGTIYKQVQEGQSVLVVTVCATTPHIDNLSTFAEQLHKEWGNPADIVATRREEDKAAMKILGADYLWLDFLDCIYRGQPQNWYYTSNDALFGKIHPDDMELLPLIVRKIERIVSADSNTVTYAPLTVGNHVDHQLVYLAVERLQRQGWQTAFYEDYPYAAPDFPFTEKENQPHTLQATLSAKATTELQPSLRPISEQELQCKIEAVLAYSSQINTLFGSKAATRKHISRYVSQVGNGDSLAERIWVVGG